jgi:predicted nucleotidyltransferase
MREMPELGLKKDEVDAIAEILKTHSSILRADIFGSRAKGDHKLHSDVDIAVYGNIDAYGVEAIVCDLDELPFVYKFDVISYESIKSLELREHIDRVGIMIYEKQV